MIDSYEQSDPFHTSLQAWSDSNFSFKLLPLWPKSQLPSCGQSKSAVQLPSTHQIDKSKREECMASTSSLIPAQKYGIMMLVNGKGQPQLMSTTIWYHDACRLFQSTNAWQIQPSLPTQCAQHSSNIRTQGSSHFYLGSYQPPLPAPPPPTKQQQNPSLQPASSVALSLLGRRFECL
jgi:hypothetical protein